MNPRTGAFLHTFHLVDLELPKLAHLLQEHPAQGSKSTLQKGSRSSLSAPEAAYAARDSAQLVTAAYAFNSSSLGRDHAIGWFSLAV